MGFVLLVFGTVGGIVFLLIYLDARKTLGAIDRGELPGAREEELARIMGAPEATISFDAIKGGSLESAGSYLKAQLFSEDSRGGFALVDRSQIVSRKLSEGLWACLVWHFGSEEATVSREEFGSLSSRWGLSGAELWELAQDNLLSEPVEREELLLGEGGEVGYAYLANGPHVASLALRWERLLPELPPERGVLLSVPNWHALLVLPPTSAPGALPRYQELLADLFAYEDPVSADVFWVRHGTWTPLSRSGEDLEMPPELEALL